MGGIDDFDISNAESSSHFLNGHTLFFATGARKSGRLEGRRRGQRLFRALLETLSQSSSSAAQKRGTDIQLAMWQYQ